jgi:hypothetical protein
LAVLIGLKRKVIRSANFGVLIILFGSKNASFILLTHGAIFLLLSFSTNITLDIILFL